MSPPLFSLSGLQAVNPTPSRVPATWIFLLHRVLFCVSAVVTWSVFRFCWATSIFLVFFCLLLQWPKTYAFSILFTLLSSSSRWRCQYYWFIADARILSYVTDTSVFLISLFHHLSIVDHDWHTIILYTLPVIWIDILLGCINYAVNIFFTTSFGIYHGGQILEHLDVLQYIPSVDW